MEEIPSRVRAFTEAQWREAWTRAPKVPKIVRDVEHARRTSNRESLFRAAYFAAGNLLSEGFSLFQNGGMPLLRRENEEWTDEILFHPGPYGVPGFYTPVAVEVIVSYEGLRPIREKYSRSTTLVPTHLASLDIGGFEIPPCRILWNLEDQSCVEEIARILSGPTLQWLSELGRCLAIENKALLEDKVAGRSLPYVDDITGLELLFAIGGRFSAARVVSEWQEDPCLGPLLNRRFEDLSHTFGPVYRGDDILQNIAVFSVCYDLIGPRLWH